MRKSVPGMPALGCELRPSGFSARPLYCALPGGARKIGNGVNDLVVLFVSS